jgi:hypothetical protein
MEKTTPTKPEFATALHQYFNIVDFDMFPHIFIETHRKAWTDHAKHLFCNIALQIKNLNLKNN